MKIADLSPSQVDMLAIAVDIAAEGELLMLAFDPIDNSIKWKVGNGVWSPPVPTEER